MRYYFSSKKLKQLYLTGSSKKYKLEKHVIADFYKVITIIDVAYDIHDFWKQPSLNFEKLQGYQDRFSFRLGKKYRLEVDMEWENEERIIGVVAIDEISKHYQ